MELDTIADFRLAERAFNEGWDVPKETCQSVVAKATERATCGDPEIEDKAGKLLLAVAKFNHQVHVAEQKRIAEEHARKLQLIELAVKLGIARNDGSGLGNLDSSQPASIGTRGTAAT